MKINSNSQNISSISKFSQSPCFKGYSRLKRVFVSQQCYKNYDKIVNSCKRPILGNIPSELIKLIVNKYSKTERGAVIKSIQKSFAIASKQLMNFDIKMAEDTIIDTLKVVLPKNSHINIKYLEQQGSYSHVFKMSFLDKNNNKLIHDKAIKLYKRKINSDIDGAAPEANIGFRIKYFLGHKPDKTNIVLPEYFDLENNFAISQFVDDELPQITKRINYRNLGLIQSDIHIGNYVKDRRVDLGGHYPSNNLLMDKTVMKIYKSIMKQTNPTERNKIIENYKEKIKNPKTPHKDKIELALKIYENPRYPILGQYVKRHFNLFGEDICIEYFVSKNTE